MLGSLQNRLYEGSQLEKEIYVGRGATECCYTDRYAYEVVKVITQKKCIVRRCDAERIDNNGMSESQEYEYSLQDFKEWVDGIGRKENNEIVLIKTKKGWKKLGADRRFILGLKKEYYDYSF
ncbi:MAG: hypothetical protein ACK5LC_17830 [Coprobacillaceae bacterium]